MNTTTATIPDRLRSQTVYHGDIAGILRDAAWRIEALERTLHNVLTAAGIPHALALQIVKDAR